MKFIHSLFLVHILIQLAVGQSEFEEYFDNNTLRFDYSISGNSVEAKIESGSFYFEKNWGGSEINFIDTFSYGEMLLEVFDSLTNKLIYSRGYSTLFKEWQTTAEADTTEMEFTESIIMPFPENSVMIKISERNPDLSFNSIFTKYIDPYRLENQEKKPDKFRMVKNIVNNGSSSGKVDLIILSEGYLISDSAKFFQDVRKKSKELFQWEPYSDYKNAFNIYAVFVPSENVISESQDSSRSNSTAFCVQFNTFGSERYLSSSHITTIRDALSGIPCDQICIMVNSSKYGGGGIYNFLTLFTSDNEYSEFLFHHEFAHGFASLADEYYSSVVPYESFYDLDYEPYQPNITTRVNFKEKWKDLLSDTVPVPTPDIKMYYKVTGLFEGAGYTPKGVFRSYHDCSMKSKINNAFCPVCQRAIEQMILFYTAE